MLGKHKIALRVPVRCVGGLVVIEKEIALDFTPFVGLELEGVTPFENSLVVRVAVFSVLRNRWTCTTDIVFNHKRTAAVVIQRFGGVFGWSEIA